MKSLESVGNVTGAFPTAAAKQCSGSGATDGTPLHSDWLNNLYGWIQDTMNRAGLTNSGVIEAYTAETGTLPLGTTATQLRTAIHMTIGGRPGTWWFGAYSPIANERILLAQGQTILIANYKDLVAATYCGDGVNNTAGVPFYKSSDSGGVTRSTSGTYFTLPDVRGCTIRMIDIGNTRDWGGSIRGAGTPNGSFQGFAMQGHFHNPPITGSSPAYYTDVGSGGIWTSSHGAGTTASAQGATGLAITDGQTYETKVNPAIQLASETRMCNIAVYIGLRY